MGVRGLVFWGALTAAGGIAVLEFDAAKNWLFNWANSRKPVRNTGLVAKPVSSGDAWSKLARERRGLTNIEDPDGDGTGKVYQDVWSDLAQSRKALKPNP
jgi:hypothetical protein